MIQQLEVSKNGIYTLTNTINDDAFLGELYKERKETEYGKSSDGLGRGVCSIPAFLYNVDINLMCYKKAKGNGDAKEAKRHLGRFLRNYPEYLKVPVNYIRGW